MAKKEVGLIVLGSQQERHGLLPEDTDTKLAVYIAFKAASATGCKIVGVINSAAEFEYLKHGQHSPPAIVLHDLKQVVENAVERLDITRFVIVNGHGGNKLISKHLPELEKSLEVKLIFNNVIIEVEGAHAASGECSMAVAAGLADSNDLVGQNDFKRFPEVGFTGLKEAHVNSVIKELAQKTMMEGVTIDRDFGMQLLEKAIDGVVNTINAM